MSERPRLDMTVNLGHIIIIVGALAGFVGSHYLTDFRMGVIEKKLDGFSGLLIDAAVTAQRIRELERRIEFVERR
jgi:uncharacterized membrane protein YeaQ/YmgE (transglycosylase-associated protein family)